MKFCYIDESGIDQNTPVAVMVGVMTDSQRMKVTKEEWDLLLAALSEMAGQEIAEVNGKKLYRGLPPWQSVEGIERAEIISMILDWLDERRHKIVYSAVIKSKFNDEFEKEPFGSDIGTLWRFMGLHIALSLQKCNQSEQGSKGNSVLVFDDQKMEETIFTELLLNPPQWTESYYSKRHNQNSLDQIIDVPHFVKSHHVGLIQLADLLSFLMRRYIELGEGLDTENYDYENDKINVWYNQFNERSIEKRLMYLSRNRCEAAELFYKYAPVCIR